jgi:hypothetical protein
MTARSQIWDKHIHGKPGVNWLIDARMGAENGVVLTTKINDPAAERLFNFSLHSDEESYDEPCTGRAIIYNVFWIASLIARQLKRISIGQDVEQRIDFNLNDLTLFIS